jgi:hypothetical protein
MVFYLFIYLFLTFFHLFYCILFHLLLYIFCLSYGADERKFTVTDKEQTQFATHKFTDNLEGCVHRIC